MKDTGTINHGRDPDSTTTTPFYDLIYPEHLTDFLVNVFLVDLLEKAGIRRRSSGRRTIATVVDKAVLMHHHSGFTSFL